MREYVSRKKQTTTDVSMPSLKHPIRGFGIESPAPAPQPLPERQTLNQHSGHDIISRISFQPQTKLTVNSPGDIFEQEADRVALQVMRRFDRSRNRPSIQRQSAPEDEELQMKPLSSSITSLQRQEVTEDEELQMKPLDVNTLQRQQAPEEEEELQMSPMVQRQANAEMAAAPDLEASINQARGGGQVMADNIREPMEVAFGADFSGVKVHTDGQSDQLNQSIQARAFTTGQDVFFRQGEYNPGSRGGQELLAHELTHVVQQSGGAVQRSPQPLNQQQHHRSPKTLSSSFGSVVQRVSVPKVQIKSAIQSLHPGWKLGTVERTIAVWEIDRIQQWDFHFSAMFDPTGVNMTKFHFTIRNGGKGDDAFAWFNVDGHNTTATAGTRENAGNTEYYNVGSNDYKKIPRKIRSQFTLIDEWANNLIAQAASFCS